MSFMDTPQRSHHSSTAYFWHDTCIASPAQRQLYNRPQFVCLFLPESVNNSVHVMSPQVQIREEGIIEIKLNTFVALLPVNYSCFKTSSSRIMYIVLLSYDGLLLSMSRLLICRSNNYVDDVHLRSRSHGNSMDLSQAECPQRLNCTPRVVSQRKNSCL